MNVYNDVVQKDKMRLQQAKYLLENIFVYFYPNNTGILIVQ